MVLNVFSSCANDVFPQSSPQLISEQANNITGRKQEIQLQTLRNDIVIGKASGAAFAADPVFDQLVAKYAHLATRQAP